MKQTRLIMGMPITIEVVDSTQVSLLDEAFARFSHIDNKYSTYIDSSEISQINRGLPEEKWSTEMLEILRLCEETKEQTGGFFDITHNGTIDPSGLVKGWAIQQVADLLHQLGAQNFCVEAGGDIQAEGVNAQAHPWTVGIRNPFNTEEIIKVLDIQGGGVATSGTYIRGQHIYDPFLPEDELHEVASLTVVADSIFNADRFATAAFAMGLAGIDFIERLAGLEGYMVDAHGMATYTSGFERYVHAA